MGLTVVFVISSVPYHVLWTRLVCSQEYPFSSIIEYNLFIYFSNIQNTLNSSDYKIGYTYLISTCLLSINSCLNPVALFCTSSQFRQHLKRYLTRFCESCSPSTDFELARKYWIFTNFNYILQLPIRYIGVTNFHFVHYINVIENCVAVIQCKLSL